LTLKNSKRRLKKGDNMSEYPEDTCPCAECPDREEEHCVCDNSIDQTEKIKDCERCYHKDNCETHNWIKDNSERTHG